MVEARVLEKIVTLLRLQCGAASVRDVPVVTLKFSSAEDRMRFAREAISEFQYHELHPNHPGLNDTFEAFQLQGVRFRLSDQESEDREYNRRRDKWSR